MSLPDFLRTLRLRWRLVLVLTLIGIVLGFVYTAVMKPEYESTSRAFVATQSGATVNDLNAGTNFSQQVVKSYARVATAQYVLTPVIDELGLHETADTFAQRVSTNVPVDTQVLEVTVRDPSPRVAAEAANLIMQRLSASAATLTPNAAGASPLRITQIDQALPATQPSSPRLLVDLLVGLALGLAVGVGVAVLTHLLDTRVRSTKDIEALTDTPVLGTIPYDRTIGAHRLTLRDASAGSVAEAYRSMRNTVRFLTLDEDSPAIVITSSVESEGKSTTVVNLAIAMADTGTSVVIVDADLRRPAVGRYLGLDQGLGLTDVLADLASLDDAMQTWGDGHLRVLPSGQAVPNPNVLLQSDAMIRLIATLRERFFDAPPLLPVSDAAVLARLTSGAIIVCAARQLRGPQLAGALHGLDAVDARLLGVVVTKLRRSTDDAYGYTYAGYAPQKT
jgi:capsular exopolysaccharide synthesis family protein